MSDLDKTRSNIGADNLDRETREKLFKEFVKSGGKVLTEREILRQKAKEQIRKEKEGKREEVLQQYSKQQKIQILQKTTISQNRTTSHKQLPKPSFIDRIKVFLNAYLQSTIKLNGYIKRKFFETLVKEIPTSFFDLRIISYLLTQKDEKLTLAVKKSLNALNPIGFELIYRLSEFPNNEIFEKIERIYKLYAQTKETTKPEELKDFIRYVFKKLYLMYPYKDQVKVLISTGLRAIHNYIPKNDFQKTEKLFYRNWEFLYVDFFPKIKCIVELMLGREQTFNSEELLKFIDIKEEETIGYLTEKVGISKIEEKPPDDKKQEIQPQKDKASPIDEGIEFINSINIKKIQDKLKRKNIYVEYNDKISITEALIEFYETNIYPILVLKAKYNVIFDVVKTIDIKKELDDSYINITSIKSRINEYYKIIEDYKNIESDIMIPITRKSGLLNTRSIEKAKLSYEIRKDISEFFIRIENILNTVIKDYENNKTILSNPDEIIEFKVDKIKDIEVEKNVFDGEKVIDALYRIHRIISGIIFLLKDGDLGGSNVKLEKPVYLRIES
ncbi:MAG: hypothetical protein N2712_01200 [Brevinematales bacterium]|nr:hypothetical protein [Brevinematales bacterium]